MKCLLDFIPPFSIVLFLYPCKVAKSGNCVAEGQLGAACLPDELFLSPRQAQISVSNRCRSCHSLVQLVLSRNEHLKKLHRNSPLPVYFVFHYPTTDLVVPMFCHSVTCFKSAELSHVHH